jgi:hypothetical protein
LVYPNFELDYGTDEDEDVEYEEMGLLLPAEVRVIRDITPRCSDTTSSTERPSSWSV